MRVSFADAVRDLAEAINPSVWVGHGVSPDDLPQQPYSHSPLVSYLDNWGWSAAKTNPEVRKLLQRIGTGARSVLGDYVWVGAAAHKMRAALDGGKSVVFTDVRFPNEVSLVRGYGGHIVRITRPGVGPVNGHISETAIDDIEPDHVIVNDSTEEELQAKLVWYAAFVEKQPA